MGQDSQENRSPAQVQADTSALDPAKARPNLSEPKSRATIDVVLPDERQSEVIFSFKTPGRDNLAASANRLLKFEFPPVREVKVFERLIKTNVLSTGLSKKVLETLPLPFLEKIYGALWHSLHGPQNPVADGWLSLFLLTEELLAFNPAQWVQQDIEQIGTRDTGAMHSYYYQGPLNRDNMITFLGKHGYRTDFLAQLPLADSASLTTQQEQALRMAYLACRRLSHPLPWTELLASLDSAELKKFPRLARLKAIQELLQQQPWAQGTITPGNFNTSIRQLQQLLAQKDCLAVASRFNLPRPVQTLVIVEGETEKILLPLFVEAMGLDLNALGIDLLPAGGKNHVLSIYGEASRYLNIPVCIVLDSDAREIAEELAPIKRAQDYIFQIAEGEFEDLYDLNLTLRAINRHYQPYPEVTRERFQELAEASQAKGRVQALRVLWQSYNLGSFDKIEFARQYAEMIKPDTQHGKLVAPPAAIRRLVETILKVRTGTPIKNR